MRVLVAAAAALGFALAPAAGSAQTRIYMHDAASGVGTYKIAHTFAGTAAVSAVTSTTAGGTRIQWTQTAGGAAVAWISAPLVAGATVTGGATLSCTAWGLESVGAANASFRCEIYRWAGATSTKEGTSFCAGSNATELPRNVAEARAITCTATAKTFMAGDRIVIEWYVVNAGGTMGSGTATASYDGTVASFADTWAEVPAAANVRFVGTPANLRTTSVAFDRVDLAWDAAAGATGYHVERTTDLTGSTGWTEVATTPSTSLSDTSVAAGTTYLYRVHAYNSAQMSPEAAPLTVPVPTAGPNPPTGVTATPIAWNRVDVSWTAPASGPEVTLYRVYRSDAPGTPLGTATPPATSFSDTTAQGSTTYTYSVSSVGVTGESAAAPSNPVTTPVEPPGAVLNLSATNVLSNRVDLRWDPSPRATQYRIERNPDALGQPQWGEIGTVSGAPPATTYSDGTVAALTGYQYRVRAYDGEYGAYSNNVTVSTPSTPPDAVTGLQTTAVESRRVALAWNASARATEYHVERTTDPAGLTDWFDIATTTATSHADTTVVAGTAYLYRVRAWNDGGYGGYSANVPASPPPAPPDAVGNLRTTSVAATQVVLAWDVATGATRYHVERNPDAAGQGVWAELGTAAGATYADGTVASLGTYQYRVRAWNAVGYGPYSNVVLTTTPLPAAPPVTPDAVKAKADSCNLVTIRAAYAGDSNGNALVSFARGTSAAGPFAAIAQCQNLAGPVSPRACTQLGGITAGQTYWYQATFTDPDNAPQPAPLVSAGLTIPSCGAVLTLSDPGGQPGNASVEAGSVNTVVGKVLVAAANGAIEVSGLRVQNVATSADRAAAGTDVLSLQLWADAGVPGAFEPAADTVLATSQWDPASGKYVFRTKLQLASGASALVFVTANVAPGARVGKKLDVSVASDDVTVSTAGASVALGTTVASAGIFTVAPGPIAGSSDVAAPMVSIVNPGPAAAVSGSYRVQVQAFDRAGLANVQVAVTTDGWTTFVPLALSSSYAVGANAGIYEGTIANPTPGAYRLQARVTNTATTKQVLSVPVLVTVNAARAGDGVLLRRDNSPQLCSDCHAIQSHSSQAAASPSTGNSKYGSWSTNCRDCHTPHGTTNVYLVKKEITPPPVGGAYQESKKVFFSDPATGYSAVTPSADPAQIGSAAYANQDYTGVCQVCHTRTADKDGNPLFRNSIGADATHGSGTRCGECHSHTRGFRPSCTGCHGEAGRAAFDETAPPRDTCGNLAPQLGSVTNRVGAHQAHLAGSSVTDGVGCDGCHVNPPVRPGHPAETQCSPLQSERAVLQWGPLAKGEVDLWSGAVTPSPYQHATQGCTATYCHGAFRNSGVAGTVSWNESVVCGDCHASPPPSPLHTTNARCDWCHGEGYAFASVTGAARATHVDGRLQRMTNLTCSSCHGTPGLASAPGVETQDDRFRSAPPQDTLGNAATTVRGVGAHRAHVYDPALRRPFLCADCHGSTPADPMHSDGGVALAFSAFASGGGAGVIWTGTPELSCWRTYCHGDNFGPGTKGNQTRPSWIVSDPAYEACDACHQSPPNDVMHASVAKPTPAQECNRCHAQTVLADGTIDLAGAKHVNGWVELGGIACNSCHGDATSNAPPPVANPANLNGAGAHRQHVLAAMTLRPGSFACEQCHPDSSSYAFTHADGVPDMQWDAGMAPSTIWNDAISTCSSAYCHGGPEWGGAAPSPVWTTLDGTYKACGACHSNPPPLNATTHHPPNPSCDTCHTAGATTTTITGGALATHIDGQENLVRSGCTLCHGDLSRTAVASGDPNAMPGYTAAAKDVTGGLSPLVSGAHLKHLTGTAIARTRGGTAPNGFAAVCSDCHQVPADGDRAHATGAGSGGARAAVPFNGFATRNGAYASQYQNSDTATENTHAGECSNVYCHGAKFVGNVAFQGSNPAPTWTQGSAATACGACHKVYPTSNGHRDVTDTTSCSECHGGYDCTKANLATCSVNYADHIDGEQDVNVPLTCTSCHGASSGTRALLTTVGAADLTQLASAPPRDYGDAGVSNQVGAHQAHVNPDPNQPEGQIFLPIPCRECHTGAADTFPMQHQDGDRYVDFGSSVWSNQRGFVSSDTPSDGSDGGTAATCTSYCHISSYPENVKGSITTWRWNMTDTVTCGSCHGSPPPDPDHTSVPKPSATTACYANCHANTVDAQGKIIFSESGASATTLHINGTPNTLGVDCNTCHGDVTRPWDPLADAQQWSMPPKATNGSTSPTDRRVGTHEEHVYGRVSLQVPCLECHLNEMPAQNKHADGGSVITGNFGPLATLGGVTPTYNADLSCSGTYCHGNFYGGVGAGPTPVWTNTATLACTACHGMPPDSSNHVPADTACGDCHPGNTGTTVDKAKHVDGVVDGEFTCIGCHGSAKDSAKAPGSRRAAVADFSKQSHHVGNGGWMGGALTNNDCAVCHFDAVVSTTGGDATKHPTLHENGLIELRDSDDATRFFQYDNNAIKALGPVNANSGNATWRAEQSGRLDDVPGDWDPAFACSPAGLTGCSKGLDRFCLSCHDEDGASSAYAKGEVAASALNPFADGANTIGNNYDQQNRGRVVDVASRVDERARKADGTRWTAQDRDPPLRTGYLTAQSPPSQPDRGPDGRNDPPYGVFSRHAIRGLSVSVYGTQQTSGWDTTTYWAKTWARSNAVLGCADCHTSDGANSPVGNAHGAPSEYLLKDASGTANEGTLAGNSYVCYICHVVGRYNSGSLHTAGFRDDYQDYTGSIGPQRVPLSGTGGNVYGYACGNCHGGNAPTKAGATLPLGVTVADGSTADFRWGTIHGTSQVLGVGTGGGAAGSAYRSTYRFSNGNSMRYYDPGNWTTNGVARGCYTIAGGEDAWSGCNKHQNVSTIKTTSITVPMQRPLKY